jgi:hypothetical protein
MSRNKYSIKKKKSTSTMSGMYARVVRQQTEYKGEEKKTEHTQLRTFYRLLFTHFQGLCSMELGEEEQEKKRRKTVKLNYQTAHEIYIQFFL